MPDIKNNLAATTDPLVTSDSALGYAQGSFWFNSTTGRMWHCLAATAGAARWMRLDGTGRSLPSQAFLRPANTGAVAAQALSATDRIVYMPFILDERTSFDQFRVRVTVAGTAGQAAVRCGLARHNYTTNKPGAIYSGLSSTIALDTTGERPGGIADGTGLILPLPPGLHWAALQIRGVASPATCITLTAANDLIGAATATGAETPPLYYERTDAAAAYANFLPTSEPDPALITPSNGTNGLFVTLRRA